MKKPRFIFYRKPLLSKILVSFHSLLKKKVKFFFKFYKINFYFIKPKIRAVSSSSLLFSSFSRNFSILKKNQHRAPQLASIRVKELKTFKKISRRFQRHSLLFKRFDTLKNKLIAVFDENSDLKYHRKYRYVW